MRNRPDYDDISTLRFGVVHPGIGNISLSGEGERYAGFIACQSDREESIIFRFGNDLAF